MARIRLERITPIITLIAFLIIWWIAPSFLKVFTKTTFEEFHAPIWTATRSIENLANASSTKIKSKKELLNEIKDLKRNNAYFKQIRNLNKNHQAEIIRLEGILNLPSRDLFRYELAHVIQRDIGSWWQNIRINKGSKHGIMEGDAVTFIGGVVGRVSKTNYYTSIVSLLSNQNFRISACFAKDGRPLFYQGKGTNPWGKAQGYIKNAPQDLSTDSINPLQLVTTGLGGTFPEGIKVGFVPWLEPDNTGMFQAGKVVLDKRLLGIKEVAVLIPYNRLKLEEKPDDF